MLHDACFVLLLVISHYFQLYGMCFCFIFGELSVTIQKYTMNFQVIVCAKLTARNIKT